MPILTTRRPAPAAPFDVPFGDGFAGVRHHAGTLLTVLAVGPGPARPHRLDRVRPDLGPHAMLRLNVVAQWMIRPEAAATEVTVLTRADAVGGDGPAAGAYRGLLGPLSAATHRRVHLTIRFTPLANPEIVARHGDDPAAPLRACLSATRRLATLLQADGLRIRPLTAANLTRDAEHLLLDDDPAAGDDRRTLAVVPGEPALLPSALDSALASALDSGGARAGGAIAALRWRSGPRGPQVTALLRRTGGSETLPELPHTRLLAPAARRTFSRAPHAGRTPTRLLPDAVDWPDSADALTAALPCAGSGLIVGADDAGHPIGLRLTGPDVPEAVVAGDLALAQRVVARLAATGTSAAVFTDRAERWAGLIEAVGDRSLLHPAGAGTAQVLVDDRPGARLGPLDGHTVLRVTEPESPGGAAGSDAPSLRQDARRPGRARASGGGRVIEVQLVGTPAEDALLR